MHNMLRHDFLPDPNAVQDPLRRSNRVGAALLSVLTAVLVSAEGQALAATLLPDWAASLAPSVTALLAGLLAARSKLKDKRPMP